MKRSHRSSHSDLGAVSVGSQNVGNPDTADAPPPPEFDNSTLDDKSRSARLKLENENST